MDPRRPARTSYRAARWIGVAAALLALTALTAFPERHVFLEGGSMGGWRFKSARPVNHHTHGRLETCRSVAVLLGTWRR